MFFIVTTTAMASNCAESDAIFDASGMPLFNPDVGGELVRCESQWDPQDFNHHPGDRISCLDSDFDGTILERKVDVCLSRTRVKEYRCNSYTNSSYPGERFLVGIFSNAMACGEGRRCCGPGPDLDGDGRPDQFCNDIDPINRPSAYAYCADESDEFPPVAASCCERDLSTAISYPQNRDDYFCSRMAHYKYPKRSCEKARGCKWKRSSACKGIFTVGPTQINGTITGTVGGVFGPTGNGSNRKRSKTISKAKKTFNAR